MQQLVYTLTPQTAFATPFRGDTLFGQCCWAIVHNYENGEEKLNQLLKNYCDNKPFLVLADALPQGFIARPSLPAQYLGFDTSDTANRKQQKGQAWLPVSVLSEPLKAWSKLAVNEKSMLDAMIPEKERNSKTNHRYLVTEAQDHNRLNRLTGTTGEGDGFAPFQRRTFWYHPQVKLTLIALIDESVFSADDLLKVLKYVGATGYGKEASCGLGKFEVNQETNFELPKVEHPNAWLTLAACAPQGLSWDAEHCYYQTFTRFGRHGDNAVHKGSPFKNPILMAASYAVLKPNEQDIRQNFCGQGITGISKAIKTTVHQGYAPVLPVQLEI